MPPTTPRKRRRRGDEGSTVGSAAYRPAFLQNRHVPVNGYSSSRVVIESVEEAVSDGTSCVVRCLDGSVAPGHVFDTATSADGADSPVAVRVTGIRRYGRAADLLDPPNTAKLELSCDGVLSLRKAIPVEHNVSLMGLTRVLSAGAAGRRRPQQVGDGRCRFSRCDRCLAGVRRVGAGWQTRLMLRCPRSAPLASGKRTFLGVGLGLYLFPAPISGASSSNASSHRKAAARGPTSADAAPCRRPRPPGRAAAQPRSRARLSAYVGQAAIALFTREPFPTSR